MALVTITGKAWEHGYRTVPADLQPELWFRPLSTSYARGLRSSREVRAALDSDTGDFEVELESQPGLLYVPVLRWLTDRSQATESVDNRARGYDEWEPFWPGNGGDISNMDPWGGRWGLFFGYGDPPSSLSNAVYFDLEDSPVRIWGPPNAFVGV